jgi:hypothetical protein
MQGNQGSKKMYAIMQAANKWEIDTKLLPDKDAVSTVDRMFLASSSSSNYDFYKITTKENYDCKVYYNLTFALTLSYLFSTLTITN